MERMAGFAGGAAEATRRSILRSITTLASRERPVTAMTRFPRLHIEEHAETAYEAPAGSPASLLDDVRSAFERATGWSLRESPARKRPEGDEPSAIQLKVGERVSDGRRGEALPLTDAQELAASLSRLIENRQETLAALKSREAELATCVSVSLRAEDAKAICRRLEWILESGAKATGCQAAGLYLLDAETTHLKLRAAWGLPEARLLDPPRSLQGATAELEALLGHAVVLEEARLLPNWQAPEDFSSAACVPVSSPTTPLGVLWVFCDRKRGFTARQTNLLEIVAGRLAADLERDMLLRTSEEGHKSRQAWNRGISWQEARAARPGPLGGEFEAAAASSSVAELSGDFHDWLVRPDGQLALLLGDAHGGALDAALTAAAAHGAARAHCAGAMFAGEWLAQVNETMWSSSAGGQSASLACAIIEPNLAMVELSLCGEMIAACSQRGEIRTLSPACEPAGVDLELAPLSARISVRPGDVLALLSGGAKRALETSQTTLEPSSPLAPLADRDLSAEQMAKAVLRNLEEASPTLAADDRTVLVLKRKPSRRK